MRLAFFLQSGFPKEESLEDFNVLIDKFEGDAAALGNVVYANEQPLVVCMYMPLTILCECVDFFP